MLSPAKMYSLFGALIIGASYSTTVYALILHDFIFVVLQIGSRLQKFEKIDLALVQWQNMPVCDYVTQKLLSSKIRRSFILRKLCTVSNSLCNALIVYVCGGCIATFGHIQFCNLHCELLVVGSASVKVFTGLDVPSLCCWVSRRDLRPLTSLTT